MNDKKEFEEAVDAVGEAFARLVAVAFTGSATLQEALNEVESVIAAMHGTLTRCAIEAAQKREVGNGAKMHEAVQELVSYWDSGVYHMGREMELKEKIRSALAEPPRNCDRFARYYEALETFMPISNPDGVVIIDFAKWLFAPYESEVTK